ncbi:hypothetical protein PMM47T1_13935 [Pseudomonas sp. M47T1]|nr:hypothetical protein PMM47T1_13935 [Pseudomonas sp. M47T1]
MARHRAEWRQLIKELTACGPKIRTLAESFHTKWHESHHLIRELVDDDDALTDMLWTWLPRYSGPALRLYRGESIDRFELGKIGSAWTDKIDTARTFARGLNARGRGGVILDSLVPAEAIIAAPSAHSIRINECEFSVDYRKLEAITCGASFPPSGL